MPALYKLFYCCKLTSLVCTGVCYTTPSNIFTTAWTLNSSILPAVKNCKHLKPLKLNVLSNSYVMCFLTVHPVIFHMMSPLSRKRHLSLTLKWQPTTVDISWYNGGQYPRMFCVPCIPFFLHIGAELGTLSRHLRVKKYFSTSFQISSLLSITHLLILNHHWSIRQINTHYCHLNSLWKKIYI